MRRAGGRRCLESRLPASHTLTRVLAAAALIAAVLVVGVLVLGSRGGSYSVHARFQNASQLVKGNLVQVAGVPVGKIQSIDLTPDGQADVRMKITDAGYRPLRRGTKAVIRQASLSGVANRYIDLQLPAADHQETIPAGGVIDQSDTTTAVDLDQLFNTFDPKTRKALSGLIRGSAASYAGKGEEANAGWAYLNPSLAASSRLFKALDADTPALKRFIGQSSQLVGDLATRRADLAGLVDHLATTTGAIGRQKQALSTAIGDLPGFMRRADTTFVNLRATLDDLQPLVDESKPVAKKLRPFLAELRPLARDARPTLRDLSALVRSPGASNDLIELTKSSVPVRDAAVGPTKRDGKQRDGAFPASTKALQEAIPELATARPYAPDLTGWFDDFSHSGLYDALGGASRAAPYVNLFAPVNGVLKPLVDPLEQSDAFKNATSLNQRWRCPGSVERGAAWKPSPDFPCDASEGPLGP
jgi:phospholipid/cholesterol/gamma-HCH transport system substrate-binding protein